MYEVLKPYQRAKRMRMMYFRWKDRLFTVKDAPPMVFDAWISDGYTTLVGFNRMRWPPRQRWGLIQAEREWGRITVYRRKDGSWFLFRLLPI